MRLLPLVAAFAVAAACAGPADAGFRPRPLFATPAKAVECYVDGAGLEAPQPRLFCWRPADGYAMSLVHGGGRPSARFYMRPSPLATGYDSLVGWSPRTATLRHGQTWRLRCRDLADHTTCRGNGLGRLAFTCVSRASALTCANTGGHGFALGRAGGARRW
jgi:hypothetical protein